MKYLLKTLLVAGFGAGFAIASVSPPHAWAAGDGDAMDVARYSCAQAVALRANDPERYSALAQWVAGWRAEAKVDTALSLSAIDAAAEKWVNTCADRPQIPFIDAAGALTKKDLGDAPVIAMAAFKCQNFLDLRAENEKKALAMIRWLDGWNASALGQTSINFYYHKKQMDSATQGCMKYDTKGLMYVVAGKYR